MGLFSKYRPPGHKFKEPERFTPAEARERRLTALLERENRFLEVQNFATTLERVRRDRSPANLKDRLSVTQSIINDREKTGHKAALIAAALRSFSERDFADAAHRKEYRRLRQAQQDLQNVRTNVSDQRRFNPTGKNSASTIYGTTARLSGWANIFAGVRNSFLPRFEMPQLVIPCVQRHERREVMFAKGYAGKGYRVRHRRRWSSGVPC